MEIIDVHPGGIQTSMTQGRNGYDSMMSREEVSSQIVRMMDRRSNYMNEVVLRKRNESPPFLRELNQPLHWREVGLTELRFGQVLVKVIVSGLCGGQLHEIKGHKGNGKFLPHLMGHEGCGIVEEVGLGVTTVKPGDKVVMPTGDLVVVLSHPSLTTHWMVRQSPVVRSLH